MIISQCEQIWTEILVGVLGPFWASKVCVKDAASALGLTP